MISFSVSVDVPDLADGIRFYASAFGFAKSAEPFPGVVMLRAGDAELWLLEKRAGSQLFCSDPFGHGFCLIERKRRDS